MKNISLLVLLLSLLLLVGCKPSLKMDTNRVKYDTGLMQVTLDTQGKEIQSKEEYTEILLGFFKNPNGDNILGDSTELEEAEAKARGNTTRFAEKKPYTLKLGKKLAASDLWPELTAGSSGSSTFKKLVLLANYYDPSMMKNDLALSMAGEPIADGHQMFQMEWTPNHTFVELNFNGKYNGQYLLTDHTQNIAKYLDFDKSQKKNKIGFFVEMDNFFDEDPKFMTETYGLPCMVKYPDWDDVKYKDIDSDAIDAGDEEAVAAAKQVYQETIVPDYIEAVINQKEDILKNGSWSEIDTAFNVDSFISFWLINTLMENHDYALPRSVYLYQKKVGSSNPEENKLFAGPTWDFDYQTLSGNDNKIYITWYYKTFFEKDEFKTRLKNAWAQLRTDGYISDTNTSTAMPAEGYRFVDYINSYIDKTSTEIRKSWEMNASLWDVNVFWSTEQFQSFEGYVYSLKAAMEARAKQLDGFINEL